MQVPKPCRKVDFKFLQEVKTRPCTVCFRREVDPAHIKSIGSGGPDEEWNVLPLCREHHSEQHQKGWQKFMAKYSSVEHALKCMGWEVHPLYGRLAHVKMKSWEG